MKSKRSSLSERFYLISNIIMILLYAGTGMFLFFWQTNQLPVKSRKAFGVVLVCYSVYRGFALIKKIRRRSDEEQ